MSKSTTFSTPTGSKRPRPVSEENDMHNTPLTFVVLFAAALGSGIVGGIFFAFSSFVMAALARIPAAQGIAAMNSINVVVVNPIFMTLFFGTGILGLAVIVRSLFLWDQPAAKYALAASMVYLVGCVVVTMLFNVPLNDRLASVADSADAAAFWSAYVSAWNSCNHVRSAAGILAAALFIGALCRR